MKISPNRPHSATFQAAQAHDTKPLPTKSTKCSKTVKPFSMSTITIVHKYISITSHSLHILRLFLPILIMRICSLLLIYWPNAGSFCSVLIKRKRLRMIYKLQKNMIKYKTTLVLLLFQVSLALLTRRTSKRSQSWTNSE